MNDELKSILEKLAKEFGRREQFHGNRKDDPYGISTAVMVAMAESRMAVEEVLKQAPAPAESGTQ